MTTPPTPRRGRPRDPFIDGRVPAVTRTLLAEAGYAATTGDAIANRAHVGKASIYRRWPFLAALVAVVVRGTRTPGTHGIAHNPDATLADVLGAVAGVAADEDGRALAACVATARHDEVIAAAVDEILTPWRVEILTAIRRTRPADAPVEVRGALYDLAGVVWGFVAYRWLVTGEPISPAIPGLVAIVDRAPGRRP